MTGKFFNFFVLIIFFFYLSISIVFGQTTTCSKEPDFIFKENNILFLNKESQGQFYFKIINKSQQTVYLNKVIAEPSASAGWSTKLDSLHYSIIALHSNSFLLSCGNLTNNGFKNQDCSKVLTLCQLNEPVTRNEKLAEKGNYWLIENEVNKFTSF